MTTQTKGSPAVADLKTHIESGAKADAKADHPQTAQEPHEQLGRSFKSAMAAVRRLRGRETHRSGELSYAQFSLLFSLAGEQRMSAKELADAAALSPATVAQMLESLELAGLVQRTRSADDRRIVLTGLTGRGEELVRERRARLEQRWREALGGFSDEELRTAAAVLERLAEHFRELDG
jgi:DNA-binding MarR family transcriptional regulator